MKDFERITKSILLALIGISTLALVLSLFLKAKDPQKAGGPQGKAPRNGAATITVSVLETSASSLAQRVRLNGDVLSRSRIALYADTAGKLVSYEAGIGSEVKKGDVVARIDPSRPGSPFAVSPVRSTIRGTIIALPYDPGDTISTSSPVATIGTLDDLEIITYVPEKYIAVLRTGLPASVSFVSWPGEEYPARVTMVSPVVETESRTVEIRLSVDAPKDRLKHGMFAVISLVMREVKNAIVVPKTAIKTFNGESVVYVAGEDGLAQRRVVTTGLTSDTETEIREGLSFAEKVIVSGSVSDGTPVRLANAGGKK